MHFVRRASEYTLSRSVLYERHSTGLSLAPLVDHESGSVHTGLMLNQLKPGGVLLPHVHAYEQGFYLLEGHADVQMDAATWRLSPGDFGVVKVGTPHAWKSVGTVPARWLEMSAPQPKAPGLERDTYFVSGGQAPGPRQGSDAPREGALLGHFAISDIPTGAEGRATSGGLKGVFLRWLIDEAFGAKHQRMVLIEYQPGVSIGLHDHTFEEAYFIVSGEVQATLDGTPYIARPGDVLWTGVGCVHAFANVGSTPVRWLETFAPQPPAENVFRFMAEWEETGRRLESR
jgi:quercetin dioxygenase-like cupin family protein